MFYFINIFNILTYILKNYLIIELKNKKTYFLFRSCFVLDKFSIKKFKIIITRKFIKIIFFIFLFCFSNFIFFIKKQHLLIMLVLVLWNVYKICRYTICYIYLFLVYITVFIYLLLMLTTRKSCVFVVLV